MSYIGEPQREIEYVPIQVPIPGPAQEPESVPELDPVQEPEPVTIPA